MFKNGGEACYSITKGVDCQAASGSYVPWAGKEMEAIKYFGLSGTGYVQNRDMEGECNGLLTYDAVPKLNTTLVRGGNSILLTAHAKVWNQGHRRLRD